MSRQHARGLVVPASRALLAILLLTAWSSGPPARAGRRDRPEDERRGRSPAQELREAIGEDWTEVLLATDPSSLADVLQRHGGSRRDSLLGYDAVSPVGARDRFAWMLQLQADPRVQEVLPNYHVHHPGCRQMSIDIVDITSRLDLTVQQPLERLGGSGGIEATGVLVAVVDSGVAVAPELEGRLLPGLDMLAPGQSGSLHGNGDGGPSGQESSTGDAWDVNGHGTAIASLIAAFAPGSQILPVRVVGPDCLGNVFDLAKGIVEAADAGAQVINVSLGTDRQSSLLARAVAHAQERGALVVGSAGNGGTIEYPAALPGVLAVTAVGPEDWPATFATTGPRVDMAAPGVDVLAAGPAEEYLRLSGTSPAAALVAAGAAGVVRRTPSADVRVRRRIVTSIVTPTRAISPLLEGQIGRGVLTLAPLR